MYKTLLPIMIAMTLVCSCKHENIRERMLRESIEYNKKCPMHLDETTTLDSVNYSIEKNQYTYYYSLPAEIASAITEESKELYRKGLLESVVNATNLIDQKKEGVTFSYIFYREDTHETLFSTTITKDDYKQ